MSEDLKKMMEEAYLMGFRVSTARYNADGPFCWNELEDKEWVQLRDEVIGELSKESEDETRMA